MASHNVINTKNITAYGSELHCRGCSSSSQAGRQARAWPSDPIWRQHTYNADRAQKPRPKYIWQPCRFLSSTYVLSLLPPFLSLAPFLPYFLSLYCWHYLDNFFVRLSACGIVCFKGVSAWLNKLGQRRVWEFGICHVALTTRTTWF